MEAVVITHNSERDLRQLLDCPSVRNGFSSVTVVDNASTDGSVALAAAAGARVIPLDRNIGFGAAANLGVQSVCEPTFALLNPDIYIHARESISTAQQLLNDDSTIGIVAPRLILPDGTTQDSARTVPNPIDIARRRVQLKHATRGAIFTHVRTVVPWAVGACWFTSTSAFREVTGFDERFKLYFEDVDLCVRLAATNKKVVYAPDIVVDHRHVAASRSNILGWANRQHVRSAIRFYSNHHRTRNHASHTATAPYKTPTASTHTPAAAASRLHMPHLPGTHTP